MKEQVREVWVIRNKHGNLHPPIDDDGTDVFMAWPSREEAERGLKHQVAMGFADEDEVGPTVERLF